MKKLIITSITFLFLCLLVNAQIQMTNFGNLKIYNGASFTVFGDFVNNATLTVDEGATLTNNGALTNSGTITNTGSFSYGSSALMYSGNSQQTIGAELPASGGPSTVIINNPAGVLLNSDATLTNLTLTNGSLNLNGKTLTVNADITSTSGNITGSANSNLIIAGSGYASNTINFDQTNSSTRTLNNFTVNRSSATITLGNPLEVTGTLNLTNGTLSTGGNLKLVSDINATARIPEITGTGEITGNVTVERYVPVSARRWRFISPTISNTTLEDWRSEIFVTGQGTGTTVGTTNSNGFDATGTNSPSVYYYDETPGGNLNYGWTAAPNTSMTLITGLGYRVFIRGDRSSLNRLNGTDNSQNAVTTNLIGTVNSGDITMPVTYTNHSLTNDDGWNMLGNPYPSQYDWYTFWNTGNTGNNGTYYSNINPTIYVWDATSNSYKSFNALANIGTIANGIIAAGQGFFIKATGTDPSMTFTEQFKTSGTPTQMFKTNSTDELKIQMRLDSINNDEFVLKYNSSSTALNDIYDTKKWLNPTVNISSYGNDSILNALDSRPLTTANDTIRLNTTGSNGTFTFKFNSIPSNGKYYFLQDQYLSNTILLNEGSTYSFTISSATPATQGYSRFRIINANTNSLPVTFGEFEANKIEKQVQLKWNTFSEINNSRFEVERSNNSIDFISIGVLKSKGNSNINSNYNFMDENPNTSTANYYRIKQIDANEKFTYSAIRMIEFNSTKTNLSYEAISVYPNPAKSFVTLSSNEIANGECVISIFSVDGSLIRKMNSTNTSGEINLNINELNDGLYTIKVLDTNGTIFTKKIMVE